MNKLVTSGIVGTLILAGSGIAVADNVIDPYTDKGTRYEMSIVSDIPQAEHIEISKDEPAVTLSKWNDEVRITIKPKFQGAGKISKADRPILSKKIEFKKGAQTAFVEPKNDTDFDIDFTLDSKPASNVFTYEISGAEDMDFFYQPALTQKEIVKGSERPDNVVGSYAVYSKTKTNHQIGKTNYTTGKLFHIYRPKALDAKGSEVWADLLYSNGILTVTVPQSFLDSATYPVIVDPTFGYLSVGASSETLGASSFNASGAIRGVAITGTLVDLNGYFKASGVGTASYFLRLNNETSSLPGTTLHVNSGEVNMTNTTYVLKTYSASFALVGANYWITAEGNRVSLANSQLAYDTGGVSATGARRDDFGAWANTTNQYSLYANYTAPAVAGVPSIQASGNIQINGNVKI